MKKKLMRFNLAALALVMVTSVLISGTFAKYTTAVSAQDTALIARWDISSEGMGATTQDLDLFGHAYEVAIENNDGSGTPILGPGVSGSFVVNLTGTADVDATIDLQIDKTGVDVPIQYAIGTDENTIDWGTATIYYSEELLAEAILESMIDDVTVVANGDKSPASATGKGENPIILKNSETTTDKDVWVHWRWLYEADNHDQASLKAAGITGTGTEGAWTNADDTALGQASAAAGTRTSYALKLTLKAEQITPEVPTP